MKNMCFEFTYRFEKFKKHKDIEKDHIWLVHIICLLTVVKTAVS